MTDQQKKTLQLFQIDAFTDEVFGGNPACVVPLEDWLPDDVLLKIAQENAVAETAYFVRKGGNNSKIHLRWFTPEIEMDLCGHATLATAHCLKEHLSFEDDRIVFETASGDLSVDVVSQDDEEKRSNIYQLNFPSRVPVEEDNTSIPESTLKSLSIQPRAIYKSRDYILLYESEEDVRAITVDRNLFDQVNLDPGGVCVTAPASKKKGDSSEGVVVDFVSRYFTPQSSILEDPVTGSAHCSLIPLWAAGLNKKEMVAQQVSDRLGTLYCVDQGERVLISGRAKTYSAGTIFL